MPNIKIEEYILVVSIPMETPIMIVKKQSIDQAEQSFITKRDKTNNHNAKVEFDRARALLKYASCSNARLVEMQNADHKLKVSFGFYSVESMIEFRDTMAVNVASATMK